MKHKLIATSPKIFLQISTIKGLPITVEFRHPWINGTAVPITSEDEKAVIEKCKNNLDFFNKLKAIGVRSIHIYSAPHRMEHTSSNHINLFIRSFLESNLDKLFLYIHEHNLS